VSPSGGEEPSYLYVRIAAKDLPSQATYPLPPLQPSERMLIELQQSLKFSPRSGVFHRHTLEREGITLVTRQADVAKA
jgi:hypothetical protein